MGATKTGYQPNRQQKLRQNRQHRAKPDDDDDRADLTMARTRMMERCWLLLADCCYSSSALFSLIMAEPPPFVYFLQSNPVKAPPSFEAVEIQSALEQLRAGRPPL